MGSIITVPFHGTDLQAITDERGVFVPLRPLVTGMGLDWGSQLQRLKRDPILSRSVVMMTTESDRQAVCLPLRRVPGFLFRIDATRIKDDATRVRVLDFQDGAYDALADACLGRQKPESAAGAGPIAEVPTGEGRKLVAECRSTFGVVQARELWFALGLPRVPSMYGTARQLSLFPGEYSRQPADGAQP